MSNIDFTRAQAFAAEATSVRLDAARRQLAQTDWYFTRQAEIGVPVPEEVLEARRAARAVLSAAG